MQTEKIKFVLKRNSRTRNKHGGFKVTILLGHVQAALFLTVIFFANPNALHLITRTMPGQRKLE